VKISYQVEKDHVNVWLLDDNGNTTLKAQLPKEDVIYAAARVIRELGLSPDKAFDIGVYAVFLKVTWDL
jgi:hypothetical protein